MRLLLIFPLFLIQSALADQCKIAKSIEKKTRFIYNELIKKETIRGYDWMDIITFPDVKRARTEMIKALNAVSKHCPDCNKADGAYTKALAAYKKAQADWGKFLDKERHDPSFTYLFIDSKEEKAHRKTMSDYGKASSDFQKHCR